jgi:hypothetical protein
MRCFWGGVWVSLAAAAFADRAADVVEVVVGEEEEEEEEEEEGEEGS